MTELEVLRARHAREFERLLPDYLARLMWTAPQLRDERRQRLRELIRTAQANSLWYAKRLAHVDADTFGEEDLDSIPPMTKIDLMRNFDDISTDRRLSRATVEAHLEAPDEYLFDQYRVVASGGSSGTRGVFAYDWNGWLGLLLTFYRWRVFVQRGLPQLGPSPVRAMIAAGNASHISYGLARTQQAEQGATLVSATLPLAEIVSRLNTLNPTMLLGYPSILAALAREANVGQLRIAPHLITTLAEPLLPEARVTMERAWSAPVLNYYGCSEGAHAGACGKGRGMHLNEDVCVFEPVDDNGRAVPAGQRAAKLYITPLFNHAQPLIRYELTDEVTVIDESCPCGSNLRRIDDIEGRTDDVFVYPAGVSVHPLTFRSVLGRESHIVEYQVRQTDRGADIAFCGDGDVQTADVCDAIERELSRLGLPAPVVTIERVDAFERQTTGKLKRFFPLVRSV